METLGYYNGKYGELCDMKVPMLDRGCYFGDGIYEVTYSRNYKMFAIEEHLDRFFRNAAELDLNIAQPREELKDILREMLSKLDCGEQMIYWQATRGTAPRSHVYPEDMQANLWIMMKPGVIQDNFKKVALMTAEDTRFLHCNIKTLNLLPSVMIATRTSREGCHEAVLHRGGRVTEGSHSNVHIIKNGTFRTAPTDHLILPGIARAHLIGICKKNGIPVDETAFTVDEMMEADEVIVSSSSCLCRGAYSIDGTEVGGRAPEILDLLCRETLKEFNGETDI